MTSDADKKREQYAMTYYRICIETLLPPSNRPAPSDKTSTHAIAAQFPVSDWMEVDEWFLDSEWVRLRLPVVKYGLLYGHQEKDDGKPFPLAERLASVEADVIGHFARVGAERQRRRADMLNRIAEFLRGFDFAAYGLARVLDERFG